MESNTSNNKLFRFNGANQRDRMMQALSPDFIKLDERSTGDFLAFAHKYSELIKFFDDKNSPDGSWNHFFNLDISTSISFYSLSNEVTNIITNTSDSLYLVR